MYRIIGGDGKAYGPVSDAQVREWVAEGRANGATRASGPDGVWRQLASFAEFADLFPAGTAGVAGSHAWVEEAESRAQDAVATPAPPPGGPAHDLEQRTAPNLLVPAILCTACCCMPAGVVAIVKAAQANARRSVGDHAGARKAADEALFWCWLSLAIGLIATMCYVVYLVRSGNWGKWQ